MLFCWLLHPFVLRSVWYIYMNSKTNIFLRAAKICPTHWSFQQCVAFHCCSKMGGSFPDVYTVLGLEEFLADLKSEVTWQHFASEFIPLLYRFQQGVLI